MKIEIRDGNFTIEDEQDTSIIFIRTISNDGDSRVTIGTKRGDVTVTEADGGLTGTGIINSCQKCKGKGKFPQEAYRGGPFMDKDCPACEGKGS